MQSIAAETAAPIDVIYIVGMGHCGSTLLNICLDRHPEIIAVGELSTLNQHKPGWSGAHDILQVPFWQAVSQNYSETTGHQFADIPFIYQHRRGSRRDGPTAELSNYQAAQSILTVADRRIIADASKNVNRLRALMKSPQFNVKVIHLVRDARAHINAYRRKKFSWPGGFAKLILKDLKIRALHAKMPHTPWLVVRYEDFASQTQATLEQICDFVGIDFTPEMLRPDTANFRGIGGNRLRKRPVEAIRLDDSWKSKITPFTLSVLTLMTSRYNSRYGYRNS